MSEARVVIMAYEEGKKRARRSIVAFLRDAGEMNLADAVEAREDMEECFRIAEDRMDEEMRKVTPDNPSPFPVKCQTCYRLTTTGICTECAIYAEMSKRTEP